MASDIESHLRLQFRKTRESAKSLRAAAPDEASQALVDKALDELNEAGTLFSRPGATGVANLERIGELILSAEAQLAIVSKAIARD